MGLALLCAAALGDIDDLAAAAKRLREYDAVYTPNPANAAHYQQAMGQYRKLYPALKAIYE